MQFFAVIDTNVIVSAVLNAKIDEKREEKSNPRTIIDFVRKGIIIPFVNAEILYEYYDILFQKRFNFNKERVFEILDSFLNKIKTVSKLPDSIVDLPDKTDTPFYAVTLSAREETDAYLVTGNIKDFPREPYIVSPKEMIDIIESKLK